MIGGRFVLAVKKTETDQPVHKARFVVQGHTYKLKAMRVHGANNILKHSVRLLITISAILQFKVRTEDVSQTYLQAKGGLRRDVYVRTQPKFHLGKDHLLKLLQPIYALKDSGDYWHNTFTRYLRENL